MKFLLAFAIFASTAVNAAPLSCETLIQPLPVYAQVSDYTCGAVCVRSVLEYMTGEKLSEEQLANVLGTHKLGYTHPNYMISFFASRGLYSKIAINQSLEDLRRYMRAGESLIVGINIEGSGHYGGVMEIGATHVTLMDPWIARGGSARRLTHEQFAKIWTLTFANTIYNGTVLRVSRNPL